MSVESEKKWCDEKLQLVYINNLPMYDGFNRKYLQDSFDYMPKDSDIIICSYPKTGTTWVSYIVWKILHKNEPLPSLHEMTTKFVPFLEMTGTDSLESSKSLQMIKHHLPYNYVQINKNAKYIYTYRNPMDTVVSYYYFNKNFAEQYSTHDYIDFDYFFERFLEGKVGYGDFLDHVLTYYEHRNDSNLLLISYEGLHRDKRNEILKIAKFLGEAYYQDLIENEAWMQEIMAVTNFKYMKQNIDSSYTHEFDGEKKSGDTAMFRKGIIGDSKNVMKPEQVKRLKEKILQKINDDELLTAWLT